MNTILKTLLTAAAVFSLILSACSAQTPTATPATPVQTVQPTVLVTALAPTPSPITVIEKIITPTALPYSTWGRLGRLESTNGDFFNSLFVSLRPGQATPAFNFFSTGARTLSVGGLEVCSGLLLGVRWERNIIWTETAEVSLVSILVDENVKPVQCTWVQRFVLTGDSGEKEEIHLLITVEVQ